MQKKWMAAMMVLCILAVCLSIISLNTVMTPAALVEPEEQKDVQYVLYLGTNDKDTNEPVMTPEEAKEKAKEILIKYFGGYTIQEANGGWVDETGKLYQEYTIVMYLSDTTAEKVHAAADEMIRVFDQSAVLIQQNETRTEFYGGQN